MNPFLNASGAPDLEWRLIYVSSPGDDSLDQELDDCLVGPVPMGVNSFEFQGSAPLPSKIPPEDVLGVAALILTGSYKDQEFVRVGYYQNTEYDNEEMKESPPSTIHFDKLVRDINTKPRVTRFQIKWCVLSLPRWSPANSRICIGYFTGIFCLRTGLDRLSLRVPPCLLKCLPRTTSTWKMLSLSLVMDSHHDHLARP